jgi:eukaryotic-like serine/threonine-protein kinase
MPFAQPDPAPERVADLFGRAADLDPAARAAFLQQECAGDTILLRTLRQLLAASDAAEQDPIWRGSALESEARYVPPDPSRENDRLDRYSLMEQIGAGGMGVVYKGVRAGGEFSQVVAIKILQGAAGDQELARRFRQERQILAGLQHPYIAHLIDGGTTDSGQPFLVMEYVDGVPIDSYAAARDLSLPDLLDLFRKICAAVSHAHAKLIVHRDLKPGNILVTPDGSPKLLDFGIAKLLDGSAERTMTGGGALTPEYASPEQVRGEQVTTAADIYSLGVLLYRLLSGRSPYRNTGSAIDLAVAICTLEPEPLTAATGRSFDRDIDTIVQVALRKEPERRYASVEQFAEDIRRWQDGYPIAARPATRGYRAVKFIRRNRLSITASFLVALALLGGVAATAWEARIANRRFNDVRKLANSYLFEFHDAIRDLPGSTPARQLVAKRALEYLDSLSRESGSDKALQLELAAAYEKVGAVQGAPNRPSLGDLAGALVSFRKAQSIRERLGVATPDTQAGLDLATNYFYYAEILQITGDLRGSAETAHKAVTLMEKYVAAQPANPAVRNWLAKSYDSMASVTGNIDVPNLGDSRGAVDLYRKSLQIRKDLVAADPASRDMRLWLGTSYGFVATMSQALSDNTASAEAFRESVAIFEQLVREEPINALYKRQLAVYSRSLSLALIRLQNLAAARAPGDRSAALFDELALADPSNAQAQAERADSIVSQGFLLEKTKDTADAMHHYEAAVAAYEAISAKHPGNTPNGLRTAYQLLAGLAIEMGDISKGLKHAQRQLEIDAVLLQANANNAGARRNQGLAYMQIGKAHELRGEWPEARSWYQRSVDLWADLKKNGTLIPSYAKRPDEASAALARCDSHLK